MTQTSQKATSEIIHLAQNHQSLNTSPLTREAMLNILKLNYGFDHILFFPFCSTFFTLYPFYKTFAFFNSFSVETKENFSSSYFHG